MNTNVLTRTSSDRELVYIWLGDKSRTTQVSYSSIVTGFFAFINKPLNEVAIEDLQLWHRRLQLTDKPNTVANKIRAIKSLFSYGVKVGYLEINVGSYIKCPRVAVFVSRTGRPLERTMIFKIVKQCAKRAGVSELASCHWLRHSHASHAIESGCNLRLLQKSLGHSKLETTERYLHINPDSGSSQFINI
jgi:site-specific recombinase XerD